MDLTMNNPRISAYLNDQTSEVPVEEIREVFKKERAGQETFLTTMDQEMTIAFQKARMSGKRARTDILTNSLLYLTRCHVAAREGDDESLWLEPAARALKTLWLTAKKIGRD